LLLLVEVIVLDNPLELWQRLYAAVYGDDPKGKKIIAAKGQRESAKDAKQNALKVFLCGLCGFSLRTLR
jgi:hypothetical protein